MNLLQNMYFIQIQFERRYISVQFFLILQKLCSITRKKSGNDNCNRNEACIDKPIKWPSGKRISFDFHEETEAAMNQQINVELMAFYYYLSMVNVVFLSFSCKIDCHYFKSQFNSFHVFIFISLYRLHILVEQTSLCLAVNHFSYKCIMRSMSMP